MWTDQKKLEVIRELAEGDVSVHSLDMQDAPLIVDEILSVLNETACEECHRDPSGWNGRGIPGHYTHCSKFKRPERL